MRPDALPSSFTGDTVGRHFHRRRPPGVTSPEASGRVLADLAVDPRWAGLRNGAYVELTTVVEFSPNAFHPQRKLQLWQSSERLVEPFRRVVTDS